jgi:predicted signal transduction protein with EAL and GGDEF domain
MTSVEAKSFHTASVGASIGVAVYPRHGGDLSALLHSADAAMYDAKRRRCGLALAGAAAAPGG